MKHIPVRGSFALLLPAVERLDEVRAVAGVEGRPDGAALGLGGRVGADEARDVAGDGPEAVVASLGLLRALRGTLLLAARRLAGLGGAAEGIVVARRAEVVVDGVEVGVVVAAAAAEAVVVVLVRIPRSTLLFGVRGDRWGARTAVRRFGDADAGRDAPGAGDRRTDGTRERRGEHDGHR